MRANSNRKFVGGYIAIVSALLVSFLVMVIAFALGFSSYFGRLNVFGSASKEASVALAEGCAEAALLKLAENGSYGGNETIPIAPPDSCVILPITALNTQKTIKTTATVRAAVTTITVVVNQTSSVSSPVIISWEETP